MDNVIWDGQRRYNCTYTHTYIHTYIHTYKRTRREIWQQHRCANEFLYRLPSRLHIRKWSKELQRLCRRHLSWCCSHCKSHTCTYTCMYMSPQNGIEYTWKHDTYAYTYMHKKGIVFDDVHMQIALISCCSDCVLWPFYYIYVYMYVCISVLRISQNKHGKVTCMRTQTHMYMIGIASEHVHVQLAHYSDVWHIILMFPASKHRRAFLTCPSTYLFV